MQGRTRQANSPARSVPTCSSIATGAKMLEKVIHTPPLAVWQKNRLPPIFFFSSRSQKTRRLGFKISFIVTKRAVANIHIIFTRLRISGIVPICASGSRSRRFGWGLPFGLVPISWIWIPRPRKNSSVRSVLRIQARHPNQLSTDGGWCSDRRARCRSVRCHSEFPVGSVARRTVSALGA